MNEDLIVQTDYGEQIPINSSMEDFCLHCGITITADNDSGWEVFQSDGVTTQKVCKYCDQENNNIIRKKAD